MRGNPGGGPAGGPGRGNGGRAPRGRTDVQAVTGLLEPVITDLGMDLEEIKISMAGRRRLLRVIVDADDGVSLDDVAEVSRRVCARLDAGSAFGEAPYTIEISSPGVDRPLTVPRHWRRAVGRLVAVPVTGNTDGAAGPAARIEGRVTSASADGVTIKVAGADRAFRYAQLGPGQVQIEFGRPDEPQEEDSDGH